MHSSRLDGSIDDAVAQPSLPSAFLSRARHAPDRVALRRFGTEEQLTLREWAGRSAAVAGGLVALGVRRGDRVALLLTTRIEFHIADMGALLLGAVPFSLYVTASTDQLSEILDNAGPRVLVTETALLDKARALRAEHAGITHLVVVDGEDGTSPGDDELTLAELEQRDPGFDADAAAAQARRDDVCTLVYTSGTTGPPKGVQFRHGGMLDCLDSIRRRFTTTEADRAISYLPMAHIAERIFGHYAAFVYGYDVTSLPDLSRLPAALTQIRPTRFFGVPRIYEKVLGSLHRLLAASPDRAELDAELAARVARVRAGAPPVPGGPDILRPLVEATGLDQAHFLAVAGAPSTLEVLEELTAFGLPINEFYGASEVIVVTAGPPDRIKLGTVGTPFPGVGLKLGEDGEVLIAGPTVTPGYFRDPERTAEVLDADGWFHTGDIGTLDDEGYLRIVDRKKALIINSSGKNMSPATIEQAIKGGRPLLSQVFVIGDRRPYNVALIVLDREAVAGFAAEQRLGDAPFDQLTQHPAVLDAVSKAVALGNERLSRVEQIKRFRVLDHDWPPGSDFLTPTSKVKRGPVSEHYHQIIEELYA